MVSKNTSSWLGYILTIIAYILIIAPTVYVLYLCAQRDGSLTVWHVICFTVGCGFLMMEGTLSVSGDAFLTSVASRTWRIRVHWILHLLGLVFIAGGMVTIFLNKERFNSAHYTSDHGKVGLTGVVLTVVAGLNGAMTLYPKSFLGCISLGPIKILHTIIGLVATILMFSGQITGVYTRWWRGTDLGRDLTVAAYVIGLFLVFVKPCFTTASRIRALFS